MKFDRPVVFRLVGVARLDGNKMNKILNETFSHLLVLTVLNFANNLIELIDVNSFNGMKSLQSLIFYSIWKILHI